MPRGCPGLPSDLPSGLVTHRRDAGSGTETTTTPTSPGDAVRVLRQRLRSITIARAVGVAFAGSQVVAYDQATYPDGLFAAALALTLGMALAAAVLELARLRTHTTTGLRRLATAGLSADVLLVSAIVWVYAFDHVSAIFAVLVLLPIEGAIVAGPRGAAWTWAAVSVLYAGREWFGTFFDNPWEWTSLTFRTGVIGVVALVVGLLVRDLESEREHVARARAEAEHEALWRARMVAMLAHDVRAPLSAIVGAAHTLAGSTDVPPEIHDRLLSLIERQGERALLLARDLLDVERIDKGGIQLTPERVRLDEVIASVTPLQEPLLRVEVDVPEGLEAWCDPDRIQQVLHNLLSNAARHGKPPVLVTAEAIGDRVELRIRDHGPGVAAGLDLFAPFSGQGPASVGLGAWVSRLIVEAHGGTLTYEQADPGAQFVVTLPSSPARPPQPSAPAQAPSGSPEPSEVPTAPQP